MNSIFNTAVSSMRVAGTRLSASSHNVANINTEGFRPLKVATNELKSGGVGAKVFRSETPDKVDLSREAQEQILSKTSFKAGLNLIRQEDERLGELIDLLA